MENVVNSKVSPGILFVIDTSGPGGAETIFIQLSSAIKNTEFRPVVVIGGYGWLHQQLVESGFDPYVVAPEGSINISYLWELIKIVRKEGIRIIHAHLFGASIYSSMVGILLRVPVISTIHGSADISLNERYINIKKALLVYGSSRIIAVSKTLKKQLLSILDLDNQKVMVIYNGINIDRFNLPHSDQIKKAYGMRQDEILIGAIGNIRGPKAYNVMLDAVAILKERSFGFRLKIVGQGEGQLLNSLLEQRAQLGLDELVEFSNFSENVEEILSNLDLFLLSSSSEGFSLATIEAMAAGVPVIATRSGGPEEIIDDKVDGLLVAVNSPQDLANAVIDSVKDIQSQDRMRVMARRKVQKQFSLSAMLEQYKALYDSLIRN